MLKKKHIIRTFTLLSCLAIDLSISVKSIANQYSPDFVIQAMYAGIVSIHAGRAVPRVYRPINAGTNTGCGPMVEENAFYCKLDHSIYISTGMVRKAYSVGGDAALAYIIGHEYAHAMQNAYGFNRKKGVISELQADCLAGFYIAAVPNLVFDNDDIAEIGSLVRTLGDNLPVWDEQHHGRSDQRIAAVALGLSATNWNTCRI